MINNNNITIQTAYRKTCTDERTLLMYTVHEYVYQTSRAAVGKIIEDNNR